MTEGFKIVLTCFEYKETPPSIKELSIVFASETEAENALLRLVINELSELNGIMENGSFPERRFIAMLDNEDHDAVINCWDGPDYMPVIYYDIVSTVTN